MTSTVLPRSTGTSRESTAPLRIAVVGIHGFGAFHVETALALERRGRARLVGLVDPVGGQISREGVTLRHALTTIHPTTEALLDEIEVDVVAVATPLHTHADIAALALRRGADVLLEKPPVTDLVDLDRLVRLENETGHRVQVGFQSLGSTALTTLQDRIRRGDLGQITSISVTGSWTRDRSYWARAPWAGRRTLDGIRVADGAVSNPFAHALMTALRIAGWSTSDAIDRVDFDLRHVNDIEADDTSSLRIHPSTIGRSTFDGTLTCAFTLAGPREVDPSIVVHGTLRSARLDYTRDRLHVEGDAGATLHDRVGLLENLLDHREGLADLVSPLDSTGAFVDVIDRMAAEPVRAIDPRSVRWVGAGQRSHPVLDDVERAVSEAASTQKLFRELEWLSWGR